MFEAQTPVGPVGWRTPWSESPGAHTEHKPRGPGSQPPPGLSPGIQRGGPCSVLGWFLPPVRTAARGDASFENTKAERRKERAPSGSEEVSFRLASRRRVRAEGVPAVRAGGRHRWEQMPEAVGLQVSSPFNFPFISARAQSNFHPYFLLQFDLIRFSTSLSASSRFGLDFPPFQGGR